jgi:PAS domain S-box-containing protein
VYRCDPSPPWQVAFLSEKVLELTGFDARDFKNGKHWASLVHPDDLEELTSTVADGLQNQRNFTLVYRIINRAGETRWVREQGQGVFEAGVCRWIEGFISDVTEQKLLELSVREAESEARRKARIFPSCWRARRTASAHSIASGGSPI